MDTPKNRSTRAEHTPHPGPPECSPPTDQGPAPAPVAGTIALDASVLVVAHHSADRANLAGMLRGRVRAVRTAETFAQARELIDATRPDLVIACAQSGRVAEACALSAHRPGVPVLLTIDHPTLDDAVEAMRGGVVDLLSGHLDGRALAARLAEALKRGREITARDQRIERLRRIAHQLNDARRQLTQHVGGLCTDLTNAYSELSDRLTLVSTATEFNALIRQELDIESLLRTALEFLLTKVGPTNAAVFLPATSGDFTLGAYVNYDGPKDGAEVLLDHLASTLAPKLERTRGVQMITGANAIASKLGKVGEWMGDVTLATFTCHNAGECLAVVALFRDQRTAFAPTLIPMLDTLSELFAKQLARVVHVHHRHLPPSKWGKSWEASETDDDIDLAA